VVLNIPLLFESGGDRRCDAVVVVTAPAEMQRERVMSRAGMSEEKFTRLLAQQVPDAEKRRRADFVVDSSKDFDSTRAQVRAILAAAKRLPRRRP
jgi:dephospho-CoA kinase